MKARNRSLFSFLIFIFLLSFLSSSFSPPSFSLTLYELFPADFFAIFWEAGVGKKKNCKRERERERTQKGGKEDGSVSQCLYIHFFLGSSLCSIPSSSFLSPSIRLSFLSHFFFLSRCIYVEKYLLSKWAGKKEKERQVRMDATFKLLFFFWKKEKERKENEKRERKARKKEKRMKWSKSRTVSKRMENDSTGYRSKRSEDERIVLTSLSLSLSLS